MGYSKRQTASKNFKKMKKPLDKKTKTCYNKHVKQTRQKAKRKERMCKNHD